MNGMPAKPGEDLRALADDYEANLVTYGEPVALDILLSEIACLEGDLAALAAEATDA